MVAVVSETLARLDTFPLFAFIGSVTLGSRETIKGGGE